MAYLGAVGIGLSAIGAGLSTYASIEAGNRMEDTIKAQLLKQKEFQKQATPEFEKGLKAVSPSTITAERRAGAASALASYGKENALPLSVSTAPNPIDPSSAARIAGQLGQSQKAGAEMAGYRAAGVESGIASQESSRKIGVISNLAASSAANTQILTELAGRSTADLSAIGSILSTVGSIGGMYGAMAP